MSSHDTLGTSTTCHGKPVHFNNQSKCIFGAHSQIPIETSPNPDWNKLTWYPYDHTHQANMHQLSLNSDPKRDNFLINKKLNTKWLSMDPSPAPISSLSLVIKNAGVPTVHWAQWVGTQASYTSYWADSNLLLESMSDLELGLASGLLLSLELAQVGPAQIRPIASHSSTIF